jgi:hypothetical protein
LARNDLSRPNPSFIHATKEYQNDQNI